MSKVKAGDAYVELSTRDSKLRKGLAAAKARLQSFGRSAALAGGAMMAGGAAIAGPIFAAAKAFAAAGDAVQKMSLRTGISTESLSTLGFAAEQSGADLASLERGIRKMQQTIGDATNGNKMAADSLANLGVSAEQIAGMTPEEQFKTLAEAISKVEDPTQKAAMALKVFGRGGAALLPMLSEGRDGIQALQDEARGLGLEINLGDANSAAELTDAMNRFYRSLKAIPFVIGSSVAPALTGMLKPITRIIVSVAGWVKENKGLVVTAAKVAAAVMAAGAAIVALGTTLSFAGLALGGLSSVIGIVGASVSGLATLFGLLFSPIGLVVAGVVALGYYLATSTEIGGKALQWLGDRFGALKTTATAAFGAIGKALAAGEISAAAKILWLTLKMEWQRGINAIQGYWVAFKDEAIAISHALIYGIAGVISDGWSSIEVAWTETIGFLSDTWALFTNGLAKTWHSTVGFIKKAWVRLKAMFNSDIDVDAEVRRIDGETAAKRDGSDHAMLGAIGNRDTARKARRAEIEQQRTGRAAVLESMHSADAKARVAARKAADQELAKSAAELEATKAQWQGAVATAGEEENQPNTYRDPSEIAAEEEKKRKRQQLMALGDQVARTANSSTQGGFNAAALRGFGADSLSQRELKAAEQTAANTKAMLDKLDNLGAEFA